MSDIEYIDWDSLIDTAAKQGGSSEAPDVGGKYEGVIKATKYKPSSTGKLGISMLLQVTEDGANVGRQIWTNQYLTPGEHMHIFFKTLEACGIPLTWWKQFGPMNKESLDAAGVQAAALIKGNPVQFTVKWGKDQHGEPKPEVGYINKGKGAAASSAAPAAAPLGQSAPAPLSASPDRPF